MDAGDLRNALRIVARILAAGERTHPPDAANHWLKISTREHVARAMEHIDRFLVGAHADEDHLAHALTRLLLAVELRERLLSSEAGREV
jgi:hypothetical protein